MAQGRHQNRRFTMTDLKAIRERAERLRGCYRWYEEAKGVSRLREPDVNDIRDIRQMVKDIPILLDALAEAQGKLEAVAEVTLPLLRSFDAWCNLGHHGICQSHLMDKPCSVARARRAFKDIPAARGSE